MFAARDASAYSRIRSSAPSSRAPLAPRWLPVVRKEFDRTYTMLEHQGASRNQPSTPVLRVRTAIHEFIDRVDGDGGHILAFGPRTQDTTIPTRLQPSGCILPLMSPP